MKHILCTVTDLILYPSSCIACLPGICNILYVLYKRKEKPMTELFWYILSFLIAVVVIFDIVLLNNVNRTYEAIEGITSNLKDGAAQE